MTRSLDPKLLRQFVVIAEEGAISRAAGRLQVAQPWLSTRLQRQEARLLPLSWT